MTVIVIAAVWLGLTAVAMVGLSFLGRAGRLADRASVVDATRLRAWHESVTLGIVAPHPLVEGEASVCSDCAVKLPGVLPGEPCPSCGAPVLESPRIITPFRPVGVAGGAYRAM